ncbi:MAG: T9SS type A sorting domain-containing protein [Bacteroidota bacterium]
MNKLTLLLLLNFIFLFTQAQTDFLVKSEKINSITQAQLAFFGLPAENDIELYKVWYNTLGVDSEADTASGLVVIPNLDEEMPLLCYQHGTTSPRDAVPSNEVGTFGELFLGSVGYVVASADYLGMGESRGFHPYLHAETEASAAIDLLRATRELCAELEAELSDQLFVTGYSQGGHAAMAAFQVLERDHKEEFPVTAAAPMSGPYNVTGTMLASILNEEEYFFSGYLVYIARGYQEVYGDVYEDLSDIFLPQYAEIMKKFDNRADYTLEQLHQELNNLLMEEHGKVVPKFMFQEDLIQAVINQNENNRVLQVMRDNDVYDWIPEAPMQLYYCEADEQVPFENSIFTDSIMNANGASSVKALSMGEDLDHFGCAAPAFLDANEFFKSFLPTGTRQVESSLDFMIFPNPVQDQLYWKFNGHIERVIVVDELGRVVLEQNDINQQNIGTRNLGKGLYFIQIHTGKGVLTKKFVK